MIYKIPQGKHTAFSIKRVISRFVPRFYRKNKTLFFSGRIMVAPYDITPDKDQDDRHKMIGLALSQFNKSNKNAAMVSFQANSITNKWDFAPYINDSFKFVWGDEISFEQGERFYGSIKMLSRKKVIITICRNDREKISYEYTWDKSIIRTFGIILPWHGGKDNDGNGVGGVSPIDLYIELSYNIE
jgi:hypothetical protein